MRVRKGYVIFCGNLRLREGEIVPEDYRKEVLANQSWKVEVIQNGKEERKEEKETSSASGSEKEEITDVAVDRMVRHAKKR